MRSIVGRNVDRVLQHIAFGNALPTEVLDGIAALVLENSFVADRVDGDGLARRHLHHRRRVDIRHVSPQHLVGRGLQVVVPGRITLTGLQDRQAGRRRGLRGRPSRRARGGDAGDTRTRAEGGLDVAGAVVLVDRGACFLFEKAVAATERGAVALVVANDVEEEAFSGGMSEEDAITIPVLSVTKADGARLRSQTGTATVVADASVDQVTTRNVIAQTKTGATDNVVMVGAHLDSVQQGPGINDNGTGVATVLETALQMGPSPEVTNAVRFGFWGGEEEGLLGSHDYVQSLDVEALKDIALYLNFDMMASPNTCYFTSDADQSLPPDPELDYDLLIPEGSPGVERTLVDAIESAGKTPQDLPFDGRSDYDGFTRAGIPAGNFDTGADDDQDAGAGQTVGRHRRSAVRPQLPHRQRHDREHQPRRAGAQRRRHRARRGSVRPG